MTDKTKLLIWRGMVITAGIFTFLLWLAWARLMAGG